MEVTIKSNRSEFEKRIDSGLRAALRACGGQAARYAAQLAPHDTGLLRNSITFALSADRAAIDTYKNDAGDVEGHYSGAAPEDENLALYVGTNVKYAAYQELGTSRSLAKPFLKPAITDHKADYEKIFKMGFGG